METTTDENIIKDNNITDFMSEKQRTYYSKKLLEAEQLNLANPKVYTFDEFQNKLKDKYGI